MPTKQTKNAEPYDIDGKVFVWHPLDDDDQRGNLADVRIPMRVKLKVIRELAGRELDASAMFDILERLIPDQADALDEMDLNDFQAMFTAWQAEYTALNGATPGE
jgi:hypothetical protein